MLISVAIREKFHFRNSLRPEASPEIPPACANCKHFVFDNPGEDGVPYPGEKRGQVCNFHVVWIRESLLCDAHEFRFPDRRDV